MYNNTASNKPAKPRILSPPIEPVKNSANTIPTQQSETERKPIL